LKNKDGNRRHVWKKNTLRRRQNIMKKKSSPPILFVNKPNFSSEESEPENSSHYNPISHQRYKLQKHCKLKRPERLN
jgi:hypothetical protein